MNALEAVIPSMFADITVSTVEKLWLLAADILWFEVCDVLEEFEDYLTMSSNHAETTTYYASSMIPK